MFSDLQKALLNKGTRRYPLTVRNYCIKLISFLVKESKLQSLKTLEKREERAEEIRGICMRFMDKAVEVMHSTKGVEPKEAVRTLFNCLTTVKVKRKDQEIKIKTKSGKEFTNNKINLGRNSKHSEIFGEVTWLEKFKTRY